MEIIVEDKDEFWEVHVVGRLVTRLAEELHDKLDNSKIESKPFVVFDLSQMTHIDSLGIGVLVTILRKCKENGGIARLACIQPHPRIVFDITKVFKIFEIYDSVFECEQSFN